MHGPRVSLFPETEMKKRYGKDRSEPAPYPFVSILRISEMPQAVMLPEKTEGKKRSEPYEKN